MANSSSDLSFLPENELVELLWENGQIMMQGQSNRAKKNFSGGSESGFSGRVEGKGYGDDANVLKFGMNGAMDSPAAAHDLPPSVPCSLNSHEEDADQWLSYAMDDGSFQSDYCSEFYSAVMTSLSNSNGNLNTADKNTSFGPAASEPGKNRVGYLFSVPQQCQNLSDNPKSKPLDSETPEGFRNTRRIQKQDAGVQKPLNKSGGAGLINFSHFSRPASLAKSNPHGIDRLHEKSCTAARTCAESTLIDSVSIRKPSSSSQFQNSSFVAMEMNESDRATETVVASSSVCSGHGAGVTSNGIIHKSKKRIREGEESGEQSDDLEEESFGVKEPSPEKRASGKRSRAAEVHNLSERRRRDRINEKMRALQELIPNCNKVDKASMLDEAIEYLKTLQLQVQMMSMGSGLCMTPMMLPAGMNMQHLRAPQMSPFSPLGVGMGIGMGMGLGFGMGMIDLNGSPGLIPVPQMQFPCPSVTGVPGIYRMPSSSSAIHSLGIPAQRLPVSIPNSQFLQSQTGLSSQRGLTNPLKVSETGPSGSQNQQHQYLSLETKGKASQAVGHNDGQESGASRNIDRKPNC